MKDSIGLDRGRIKGAPLGPALPAHKGWRCTITRRGQRRPARWRSMDGSRGRRCELVFRLVKFRPFGSSNRFSASSQASSRGLRRRSARLLFSTSSGRIPMHTRIVRDGLRVVAKASRHMPAPPNPDPPAALLESWRCPPVQSRRSYLGGCKSP